MLHLPNLSNIYSLSITYSPILSLLGPNLIYGCITEHPDEQKQTKKYIFKFDEREQNSSTFKAYTENITPIPIQEKFWLREQNRLQKNDSNYYIHNPKENQNSIINIDLKG